MGLNKGVLDVRNVNNTGNGMLMVKSQGKSVLVRGKSRKKDNIKMYFL
jgi:hypothetical protein